MTKKEFIDEFYKKEKPSDISKAMPFLMENLRIAKENGLDFTKEEIRSLCMQLSTNLSDSSRRQVESLLKML